MEFIITIALVVAGVATRNICKNMKVGAVTPDGDALGVPLQQRGAAHTGLAGAPAAV